jgi:hypothetical protein
MDAGRNASLIGEDKYALGINLTVRGGTPRTRASWMRQGITFRTDEEQTWFQTQLYQGAGFYLPRNGLGELVVSVGGRIWTISLCTFSASEITPGGPYGRSNRCTPLAYFVQAEQFMVIQNGLDLPVIYDGGVSRRANGIDEIPTGTVMAYGQGRIWMVKGDTLIAGDLVGSIGPNSVITFRERLVPASGGDLSPSYTIGPVVGLSFIPQQDTTTGQGSLLVYGTVGITSVYADRERSLWAEGIARVTLINTGGTGHRSITPINGDDWFRANDGWRSYRQARAEIQNWARVPFSTEVQPFIDRETRWLLPYTSSIRFDNRLLATTSPRICNGRVSFQGLLALDFQILSQLGSATNPAWDGIWTGANILELVQAQSQAFAFVVNAHGQTDLIELLPDSHTKPFDQTEDGDRQIQARMDTRAYSYVQAKSNFFSIKKLTAGTYSLQNIVGPWSMTHLYRPYGATCWSEWNTRAGCIAYAGCRPCGDGTNAPNYRSSRQIGIPQTPACDTPSRGGAGNSGYSDSVANAFQFSHRWGGSLSLRGFESITVLQPDNETDMVQCQPEPTDCVAAKACCEDFFAYTPPLPPFFLPAVSYNPAQPQPGVVQLVYGCNDPAAINYNPAANTSDGSCVYDVPPTDSGNMEPGGSPGTPPPPPDTGATGCDRYSHPDQEKCYNLN